MDKVLERRFLSTNAYNARLWTIHETPTTQGFMDFSEHTVLDRNGNHIYVYCELYNTDREAATNFWHEPQAGWFRLFELKRHILTD